MAKLPQVDTMHCPGRKCTTYSWCIPRDNKDRKDTAIKYGVLERYFSVDELPFKLECK